MRRFYGWRVIAVQDGYKLMPWADAVYGCDDRWWKIHGDCGGFAGERWSTHDANGNDKLEIADTYGVRLVAGKSEDRFSFDPSVISYGSNSGFQAVNLALLKGCREVLLVGFDMRLDGGKAHFFGDHPAPLHNRSDYNSFVKRFATAAKQLPADVKIVNATPGSALDCFPMQTLEAALAEDLCGSNGGAARDRPDVDARADRNGEAQGVCAGGL